MQALQMLLVLLEPIRKVSGRSLGQGRPACMWMLVGQGFDLSFCTILHQCKSCPKSTGASLRHPSGVAQCDTVRALAQPRTVSRERGVTPQRALPGGALLPALLTAAHDSHSCPFLFCCAAQDPAGRLVTVRPSLLL